MIIDGSMNRLGNNQYKDMHKYLKIQTQLHTAKRKEIQKWWEYSRNKQNIFIIINRMR